jgi:olfactory receptor
MQGANHSAVTEFIFIGFSTFPRLQLMFFLLFLLMYLHTAGQPAHHGHHLE